jgi:TatA/E family protein of Tat protein translocase
MLGMNEIIVIMVIALIVFGPRKLPDLGKSLGQAMAQFRRASDDFKRTWEQEVELEKNRPGGGATSSSYSYNSPESDEPYNPYAGESYRADRADSSTAKLPETNLEKAVEPETVAAKAPEKKHWI